MKKKREKITRGVFRSLRTERVADRVAAQLKKVIREGAFRPGDRLPSERDLAEEMGVSRPSVREAIQKLETLGMLESIHGDGTVVRNLTEQELAKPLESLLEDDKNSLVELNEVRACLESRAARLAATNRTNGDLDLIRGHLETMERDLEGGRIRPEADFQFHFEIAVATHNRFLLHLMQSIHELVEYSMKVHSEELFVNLEDQQKLFSHHLRVFKGIQNQDPDAAEAAMNEHFNHVIIEYKRRFLSGEAKELMN